MRRLLFGVSVFCLLGCHPNQKFVTHEEYVEQNKWNKEKGWVKNWESKVTIEWNKD